jgi:hypothetical protein
VTNDTVEIHRKGRDPYVVPNCTNYLMFSNFMDALPLSENDRRYLVLSTAIQTKAELSRFNAANPEHFNTIFSAVSEHPDVLRGWLMGWKFSDEFEPKKSAPDTKAKKMMQDINRSDDADLVQDILEKSTDPEVCDTLLNTTRLQEGDFMADSVVPKTRALRSILEASGFVFLGRFRTSAGGPLCRYYSKRPELFRDDPLARIREWTAGLLDES